MASSRESRKSRKSKQSAQHHKKIPEQTPGWNACPVEIKHLIITHYLEDQYQTAVTDRNTPDAGVCKLAQISYAFGQECSQVPLATIVKRAREDRARFSEAHLKAHLTSVAMKINKRRPADKVELLRAHLAVFEHRKAYFGAAYKSVWLENTLRILGRLKVGFARVLVSSASLTALTGHPLRISGHGG